MLRNGVQLSLELIFVETFGFHPMDRIFDSSLLRAEEPR